MPLSSRTSSSGTPATKPDTTAQWVGPSAATDYYKTPATSPTKQASSPSSSLSSRSGQGQTVLSAPKAALAPAPVMLADTPIATPGAQKQFPTAEAERAYVDTLTTSEARKHFGAAWGKMGYKEAKARGAMGTYGKQLLPFQYERDEAKTYYRNLAKLKPEEQGVAVGEGFFTRWLKPVVQNSMEMGLDAAEVVGMATAPDQMYPLLKQFTIAARRQVGIPEATINDEQSRLQKQDEFAVMGPQITKVVKDMAPLFYGYQQGVWKWRNAVVKGDMPAANEIANQMAFDARQGLSSFSGLGDRIKQEWGITADKEATYVKGQKNRTLSKDEKSVAGLMTPAGALGNSVAIWTKVSPWIEKGVIAAAPETFIPLMDKSPLLFRGVITNAVEEMTQAVVSGIAGVPYNIGDTLFGLLTQFAATGVTVKGGRIPELKDVDIEGAFKQAEDATQAFVMKSGRMPSTLELQTLIGKQTVPGSRMTWNDLHRNMAQRYGSEFGENRLIARDTVEKFGRPDAEGSPQPKKIKLQDGEEVELPDGGFYIAMPSSRLVGFQAEGSIKPHNSDGRLYMADSLEGAKRYAVEGADVVVRVDSDAVKNVNLETNPAMRGLEEGTRSFITTENIDLARTKIVEGTVPVTPQQRLDLPQKAAEIETRGMPLDDVTAARTLGVKNDSKAPVALVNGGGSGKMPPKNPATPEGSSGLSSRKKVRKFFKTLEKIDLTDPEVRKQLAASPVREYQPITNKETLAEAQRIIDTNREEAFSRINRASAEPDALTVAIGMDMMRRLQNEGSIEQAVDIAEKISMRATTHGQAVQALVMWGRLTPEGALVAAAKKIREVQDAAPAKIKNKKRIADDVASEMKKVNEEVIDQVIEDVVPKKTKAGVSNGSGKDANKAENASTKLAKSIIQYTKEKAPGKPDPVRDMVQTLLKVAQERIVAPDGAPPRDPMELIAQAIRERGQYSGVWDEARAIVAEKFKDDSSAMTRIEEYMEKPLSSPFARRQVANIVQGEIKAGGIDIGKLVREHYSNVYRAGEDLRTTLIEKSGLSAADAQDLSIAIQRRFYELTNTRKQGILNTMLGEKIAAERKTEVQRIIEMSNLGAFDFEGTARLAGEKIGLPELTPEIAKDITEMANRVQEYPEGSRGRVIESALLLRYLDELQPTGIGAKAGTAQTIFMLLNPKTFIRNFVGNFGQVPTEAAAELVAWPLDAGVSYILRTPRTRAMPAWIKGEFVGVAGFRRGLKEGIEEAVLGIDTRATESRYVGSNSRKGRRVFTGPIMGNLERAMRIELQGPDRAFFERAVDISLENQMRAAGKNAPDDAMVKRAAYDGARAVFEDESLLRSVFTGLKQQMNRIGFPEAGKKFYEPKSFGLGDFLLKFPGVPANIITRGLEFSPVGFAKTIIEGARPMFTGAEFDQRAFVDSFARAAVGTTGLIATGYQLARIGVITGAPQEDSEINAVQRHLGMGQYKLNSSALYRYVLSGFDAEAGKRREGDVLYSYDWFQPHAIGFSMGANVFFENDKVSATSLLATVLSSVEASIQTIEEQPLLQSLRRFSQGDTSTVKRFAAALKDAPASFIPTFLNQITQLTDNVSRETFDPNPAKEMMNKVQAKIPGLSSRLPPRINPETGKVQQRYQQDSNNLFNVFFNPAFVTKAIKDPAMEEVLGIYERTGDARGAPRVVPRNITVNGGRRDLTGEEIATYQQYVAKEMRYFYDTIIQQPQWAQAGDEMKADELQKILNGINQAAKIQLFSDRPKSVSNYAKMILLRRGFRP